jgi:hypothetical protein
MLNKSKLSGLVNMFTMVRQLVCWWWWCCCLFLRQCTTVSSTTVVAVAWRRRGGGVAAEDNFSAKVAGNVGVDGGMTACDDKIGRRTTTQQPTNKRRRGGGGNGGDGRRSEGGKDIFPGCHKERAGECTATEADRWHGARSPDQKCSTSTQKCSTSTQK